jgi:hypothetical protein
MESLKKHRLALVFIALLILTKWLIVPLYDWQQSTLASNNALAQRLAKSAYALENQQQTAATLAAQTKLLEQAENALFNYQAANSFQLAQQKVIEGIFATYQMDISRLAWQIPVPLTALPLTEYEMKLRFTGKATALSKLLSTLNSQNQWFTFDDFQFRFDKRRDKRLGEFDGRISIKMYMREKT